MKLRLSQQQITVSHGRWRVIDSNTHQCGNVRVVRRVDPHCKYRDDWRIEVRNSSSQWVEQMPRTRPHGYSSAGAAKSGASLVAAWQRGVMFR
jgi:hypothetical protein